MQRAIDRLFPEHRGLLLVTPDEGAALPRLDTLLYHGTGLIGLTPEPNSRVSSALTLQARVYPVRASGQSLTMMLDLGFHHGIHPEETATVMVEGISARMRAVRERFLLIEAEARPEKPSPWCATLLGCWETAMPDSWPWRQSSLAALFADLSRTGLLWARNPDGLMEVPMLTDPR